MSPNVCGICCTLVDDSVMTKSSDAFHKRFIYSEPQTTTYIQDQPDAELKNMGRPGGSRVDCSDSDESGIRILSSRKNYVSYNLVHNLYNDPQASMQ